MNELINIENEKQNRQKPPVRRGRTTCEILAGAVTGFAAGLPVAYAIRISYPVPHRVSFDWQAALPSFVVFSMVYGPGSAVGVYLVGRIGKQTGSFLSTLGWGFLGGLVMLVMVPIAWSLSDVLIVGVEQIVPWSLWALVLLIPPIAASYGFNLGISRTFTWFSHLKDTGKTTDESISVEKEKQAHEKPPLSVGRIAGEILAGMAAGFAAGLPVTLGVIAGIAPRARASSEFGGAIAWGMAVFYVFPAAYGLGSAIGVYLVGRIGKQTGSFLLTLGCGFLGGLGAIAILRSMPLAGIGMAVEAEKIIPLSLLPIPPILATLGFNATRRYRASFKREQKGKTGLSVPNWVAALALTAAILALVVLLIKYLADILPWLLR